MLKPLRRDQSGAALLELALVLPVLFVLFFGSLELVRALEVKAAIAMFSRQAAHSVFSNCIELDVLKPDGSETGYIPACVQSEVGRLQGAIATIVPGMKIIVNVYTYESGVQHRASYAPYGGSSNYDSTGNGPGMTSARVQDLGKVVIAETMFEFVPIIYLPLGINLREVAIY